MERRKDKILGFSWVEWKDSKKTKNHFLAKALNCIFARSKSTKLSESEYILIILIWDPIFTYFLTDPHYQYYCCHLGPRGIQKKKKKPCTVYKIGPQFSIPIKWTLLTNSEISFPIENLKPMFDVCRPINSSQASKEHIIRAQTLHTITNKTSQNLTTSIIRSLFVHT